MEPKDVKEMGVLQVLHLQEPKAGRLRLNIGGAKKEKIDEARGSSYYKTSNPTCPSPQKLNINYKFKFYATLICTNLL